MAMQWAMGNRHQDIVSNNLFSAHVGTEGAHIFIVGASERILWGKSMLHGVIEFSD